MTFRAAEILILNSLKVYHTYLPPCGDHPYSPQHARATYHICSGMLSPVRLHAKIISEMLFRLSERWAQQGFLLRILLLGFLGTLIHWFSYIGLYSIIR